MTRDAGDEQRLTDEEVAALLRSAPLALVQVLLEVLREGESHEPA